MGWIRYVSVVVGLNQKPIGIVELIETMYFIIISLDDWSFVGFGSWHDEIGRSCYPFRFESLNDTSVGCFLLDNFAKKPTSGYCVFSKYVDEIIIKFSFISGIDFNCEGSRFNSCESEDAAYDGINCKEQPISSIVLEGGC